MSESPEINSAVPHPARVYDYWLGGKDNFRADREAGDEAITIFPKTVESARACRAFLSRVVTYLAAEAGIRQFLDLGSGLPSARNVHEVAQSIAPDSRVVYVDNDPIVMIHARALLKSSRQGATGYIQADLRRPEAILAQAGETLDFSQPVAVLLLAVLHFVTDAQDPAAIIAAVMDALPPGSYLAVGHHTADLYPELRAFAARLSELNPDLPATLRDRRQVTDLFAGLDLVPPGVVQISRWRPETELEASAAAALWGGVARKP
ncbi:MAG TPA: SAM-dependent methyltransferase [Trebonia sp.]|jgi:O-methyltransferase involved in polyketide biosynthesis|nr:SAM-dependent methyltransferase [Trebonia sp.]